MQTRGRSAPVSGRKASHLGERNGTGGDLSVKQTILDDLADNDRITSNMASQ
jgi:hypothetical protein